MSYDSYFGNLIAAFSQFFHAIIGGDRDISISGRVGYMAMRHSSKYWQLLEWVIDTAFYPLDGEGHCWTSYVRDKGERYKFKKGSVIMFALLTILVMGACIPFSVITWGVVYPIKSIFI